MESQNTVPSNHPLVTLIGIKRGMSAVYDTSGKRVPVSKIEAQTTYVIKNKDIIQIAAGKKKNAKKTDNFYITKLGFAPRKIVEIKTTNETLPETLTVSVFEKADLVKVTGVSKGRGFAGGIKRWGFHGGPKTHGQSDRHRAPGSIGQTTTPGRVFKGKKMAGHMGAARTTVRNLEVIEVDVENNLLLLKGAVPGAVDGYLIIEKTGKAKAYVAPPEEKPDEDEEGKEKEKKEDKDAEGQKDEKEGKKEGDK